MKLSKYAKLVKEGGYCLAIHAEDSGIWLGTRAALFRATELPDMVGEEQVRTVLDIPEKAWEKVHLEEKWVDSVHDIFGLNLSDFETGEQDTTKLKMLAAPDGLWCACRRRADTGGADLLPGEAAVPHRGPDQGQRLHPVHGPEDGRRAALPGGA